MKHLLFCSSLFVMLIVLLAMTSARAQATNAPASTAAPPVVPDAGRPSAVVNVWPDSKMLGNGAHDPETVLPAKDPFHRVTNVSVPTLSLFPAKAKKGPAPVMIVCPGGGYSYVVVDKEGSEIAAWLNSHDVSALVLKYRTPHNRASALQDVQRAISLTRTHATEWNIDPKRLGVVGFSAGGNLAAKASNQFDTRSYPAIDGVDKQSCRPDFAVLVYPAYLDDRAGHLSPDLNLKANIPPTLIVHNDDDQKFILGSKLYHAALDAAKLPNKFLDYPTGGHGYGLHCARDARAWPQDALVWLEANHLAD